MYIRREVYFSAWDDMLGEERLFSTTELVPEEDYLDELLFSDDDNPWKGAAVGGGLTAGALGAGAAGAYLGTKGLEKLAEKRGEARKSYINAKSGYERVAGGHENLSADQLKKLAKKMEKRAKEGTYQEAELKWLQKYEKKLRDAGTNEEKIQAVRRWAQDQDTKLQRAYEDASKAGRLERWSEKGSKWGHDAYGWMKRNPKLAAAIGAGTVALGTGAGAYLSSSDKKKRR